MKNKREFWRDIVGWEGYYQVSNICRVRSVKRTYKIKFLSCLGKPSKRVITYPSKLLRTSLSRQGYVTVQLTKHLKPKMMRIHRLMAQTFIKRILGKNIVNHKNGKITDNRLNNLEWVNHRENNRHCRLTKSNGRSKYYGVRQLNKSKKWIFIFNRNGKSKRFGRFDTEKKAAEGYKLELQKNKMSTRYLKFLK